MSDYIEIEAGLVISEDGEIIDAANVDDPIAFLARQRHEAKVQEKEWAERVSVLDRVLLKQQGEKRMSYGTVVVDVRTGTYPKFDRAEYADAISEIEFTREELMALVLAAKDFDRASLPAAVVDIYDEALKHPEKRPWIQTSNVRKAAPAVRKVAAEEVLA